jgi:hypothetical protein
MHGVLTDALIKKPKKKKKKKKKKKREYKTATFLCC